jgi:hypothetical protein
VFLDILGKGVWDYEDKMEGAQGCDGAIGLGQIFLFFLRATLSVSCAIRTSRSPTIISVIQCQI